MCYLRDDSLHFFPFFLSYPLRVKKGIYGVCQESTTIDIALLGGGNRNVREFTQCTNEETGSLQDVSVLAGYRYQSGAEWTASN